MQKATNSGIMDLPLLSNTIILKRTIFLKIDVVPGQLYPYTIPGLELVSYSLTKAVWTGYYRKD